MQLLESLLDLRATYDDLEPTLWPTGSGQDLLLRLVPAKGPTEPLPSDTVVEALDAYFRFLRSTGRMSARSAMPADLAKEARRSAKKMTAFASTAAGCTPRGRSGPMRRRSSGSGSTQASICCSATWMTIRYLEFHCWATRYFAATYGAPEQSLSKRSSTLRRPGSGGQTERRGPDRDFDRRWLRSALGVALYRLSDLGIFLQTGNEVTLNAWGDVFVSAWLNVELGASEDDA